MQHTQLENQVLVHLGTEIEVHGARTKGCSW